MPCQTLCRCSFVQTLPFVGAFLRCMHCAHSTFGCIIQCTTVMWVCHATGPHPAEGRLSGSPHPRGPGCAAPGGTAARPPPSLPLLHATPHSPPRSMSPSQPPSLSLQVPSVWVFCVSMRPISCNDILTVCKVAAGHSLTVKTLCWRQCAAQSDLETVVTDYLYLLKNAVHLPELVL